MPHFIPDGHHTITPYLVAHNVAKLIEFVKAGLGGREIHRMTRPDGGIGHAQVQIGDSRVMMGEPMGPAQSPFPAMLYLYVPDCDAVYASAIRAGATSIREPSNQFYGDRSGGVKDFAGNQWWLATHVEDLSGEEIERRAAEVMKKG